MKRLCSRPRTLKWFSPIVALALVGCSGTSSDQAQSSRARTASRGTSMPPLDSGLVFTIQVDSSGGRYRVVGVTNLPDSTVIVTGIQHRHRRDLMYEDRSTVSGGRFSGGPFGPASGLAPGEYVADATMPYSSLQAPAVRVALDRGLVSSTDSMVKHEALGYTVSDSLIFRIGGPAGVAIGAERGRTDSLAARGLATALRELVARGEAMEVLRSPSQSDKARRCGVHMRSNQAKVDSLGRLIDSMPLIARIDLGVAASEARQCVSCLESSLVSCRAARASLSTIK